jgi:hypothetical protein
MPPSANHSRRSPPHCSGSSPILSYLLRATRTARGRHEGGPHGSRKTRQTDRLIHRGPDSERRLRRHVSRRLYPEHTKTWVFAGQKGHTRGDHLTKLGVASNPRIAASLRQRGPGRWRTKGQHPSISEPLRRRHYVVRTAVQPDGLVLHQHVEADMPASSTQPSRETA